MWPVDALDELVNIHDRQHYVSDTQPTFTTNILFCCQITGLCRYREDRKCSALPEDQTENKETWLNVSLIQQQTVTIVVTVKAPQQHHHAHMLILRGFPEPQTL